VIWSPRRVDSVVQSSRFMGCITSHSHATILLPFALAVLSTTYALPSDLRGCRTEIRWEHLFRTKNEAVVRSIQTQLHCCGFNSMHDRAWPFPSRNVLASACETTSGFRTYCGPLLKEKVLYVATINGLASASNTVMLLLLTFPTSRLLKQGHSCPPGEEDNVRSDLLHGGIDDVRETFEEDQRRRALRDTM